MKKKRCHSGGIIGLRPSVVPVILNTDYPVSRNLYENFQKRLDRQIVSPFDAIPLKEAGACITPTVINVVVSDVPEVGFGDRQPRTGDTAQMVHDIERTEETPAAKFRKVKERLYESIRHDLRVNYERMLLDAIRGRR